MFQMQLNLKLADKKKSQIIKLALQEIVEGVVFSADGVSLTDADLPSGRFKIGELADKISSAQKSILIGDLEFDFRRKTVKYKAAEVQLTEIEVKIIEFLHQKKNATREELLQSVWGYSAEANTRTVETHIHRLNQKMQESFGKKIIESSNGGYGLVISR